MLLLAHGYMNHIVRFVSYYEACLHYVKFPIKCILPIYFVFHGTPGVKHDNLYVAKHNGKIVSSVILSHEPETAYYKAIGGFESDYTDVFVVHIFVVHPEFLKCGVGKALI